MQNSHINKLTIEEISKHSESHLINNFILSKNHILRPDLLYSGVFVFDGFILGLCNKGKGKLKINYETYKLTPGTIFMLPPNRIIKMEAISEDFNPEILFLSFDLIIEFPTPKDFNLFDNFRRIPCVYVTEDIINNLLGYHEFIIKQYDDTENAYREEIVKSLLYALILKVISIYRSNENSDGQLLPLKYEEMSDNFFKLLTLHYKEERKVSFYADKMYMTPKYLSAKIKEITGKSIPGWINDTIISEAKIKLKTSNQTVLQISEELNFVNPSFFGQFFKQHTGMTPLEYRRS